MSKRKFKNIQVSKKDSLQYSTAEVIVPALILLAFIVLILLLLINTVFPLLNKQSDIDYEQLLWEQAFLEAEKTKVGIIFDSITTSEEEYTNLKEACTTFLEEDREKYKIDGNVDVDIVIDEEQFIDEQETSTGSAGSLSSIGSSDMAETGPIYFQDMLIMRYINEDGILKVIIAYFNEDKTDISVIRKDKLAEILNNNTPSDEEENNQAIAHDWVSEKEYLENIDTTLKSMLLASDYAETREAESLAIKYFTVEGNQTVFGNKNDIKLSSGSEIDTIVMVAGKSDSSKSYKDRIYTQLRIHTGDETYDLHIILKLNSNLRIFDIDII